MYELYRGVVRHKLHLADELIGRTFVVCGYGSRLKVFQNNITATLYLNDGEMIVCLSKETRQGNEVLKVMLISKQYCVELYDVFCDGWHLEMEELKRA